MSSLSRWRSASASSAPKSISPRLACVSRLASVMFSRMGKSSDQPGALAILRHQIDALLDRAARRGDGGGRALDPDLAALQRVEAEDGARELGAARADETGEPEDLSPPHRQADGLLRPVGGPYADQFQDRVAGRFGRRPVERLQVAADHVADHRLGMDLVLAELGDPLAVAQHDDTVGRALHLGQPMRDEDDRHALGLQPGDDLRAAARFRTRSGWRSARP